MRDGFSPPQKLYNFSYKTLLLQTNGCFHLSDSIQQGRDVCTQQFQEAAAAKGYFTASSLPGITIETHCGRAEYKGKIMEQIWSSHIHLFSQTWQLATYMHNNRKVLVQLYSLQADSHTHTFRTDVEWRATTMQSRYRMRIYTANRVRSHNQCRTRQLVREIFLVRPFMAKPPHHS